MMVVTRCLMVLLVCAAAAPAAADNPIRHFRHWMVRDGLPRSESWFAGMFPSGNLWCTFMDLAIRIDGYGVDVVKGPARWLPYFETPGGQLWTLLYEERREYTGFRHYDPGSGRWIEHPVPGFRINPNTAQRFRSVWPRADDYLLYVHEEALMFYDAKQRESGTLLDADRTRLGQFLQIAPSPRGGIWVSGLNGLARVPDPVLDGDGQMGWEEFVPDDSFGYSDFREPAEHNNGAVVFSAMRNGAETRVLAELRDGQFRVALDWGTNLIQGFYGLDGELWAFHVNPDGRSLPTAWLRRKHGEVEIVSGDRIASLPALSINGLPDGSYWYSTKHGHLHYLPSLWNVDELLPPFDGVRADIHFLTGDSEGRLYCLGRHELAVRDGGGWSVYPLPEPYINILVGYSSMHPLPNGKIALQCHNSYQYPHLLLFDPGTESFETVPHPDGRFIRQLFPKSGGNLWVQTSDDGEGGFRKPGEQRIEMFDGERFIPWGHSDAAPVREGYFPVLERRNGEVWFHRYDQPVLVLRDGVFHSVEAGNDGLRRLFRAAETAEGRVWVVEQSGMGFDLREYDGGRLRPLRNQIELTWAILPRGDETVWLATESYLLYYKDGVFIEHAEADGLPAAMYTGVYEDAGGRLWAAGANGIARFDPSADPDPPETLMDETQNSARVAPNTPPQFLFSGIDKWKYTAADRLYFSYRHDNGAWSPFRERTSVTLPALEPGPHVFEVRAMDRNGNIDPSPRRFAFEAMPPWYRENAFIALACVGGAALCWLTALHANHHVQLGRRVSARTRELQAANARLRQLSAEIMNVEENERRTIAAGLHDHIGQSLSLCQIKLEAEMAKAGPGAPRAFLGELTDTIRQTVKDARSLVFEISPPVLYDIGLEAAIEQLVIELRKKHAVPIRFTGGGIPEGLSNETRVFLYRSARELLFNAIKHAGARSIRVSAFRRGGQIRIRVEDDGKGMNADPNSRGGFGLFHMRERLASMGGGFEIQSQPGGGTTVTLTVPAGGREEAPER